mgnify:FL=1|tara:strand:+ start:1094 stop:1612 length:519 start_codon:yes stop_codon:yes gene_type:complete
MSKFSKSGSFILYKPTSDDISLAHTRATAMGVLPNSFTKGMGRMTGCLGEIAVNKFISKSKYVGDNLFTHDLEHKKKRIEIKSKTCSSIPKPEYIVSVNTPKSKIPDNDVYFFTRVRKDLMFVWILGWLPTTKYFSIASFMNRGDKDEHGFMYKASGYHTAISELNDPKEYS